jgi:hypothetical protein
MIGMRVRYYGALDRTPGIDMKSAGGAVEPGVAKFDHNPIVYSTVRATGGEADGTLC